MPPLNSDLDVALGDSTVKQSMFKPGDVGALMDAVGANNEQLKQRSAAVQDIFAQQQLDAADMISQQNKIGENSQIVLKAKEMAALQVQEKSIAIANNLGINPAGSSELLDRIGQEWKNSKLDAIDKRNKLKHDLEINFFEHPVDYVVAQVKLENTVQQAEVAAARVNSASKDMQDIQQLTQNIPAQMSAIERVRTGATVQATLEGAQATINANLDEQKIKNSGINLNRIQALNTMDAQSLSNLGTAMSAHNQAASLQISQKHLALSERQFAEQQKMNKAALDERLTKLEDKATDRAELEDAVKTVRQGAASLGITGLDGLPAAKILTLLNSKNANIVDYYQAGISSQTAGKPIISQDPGQVGRMIIQHNAPGRPEQKQVFNLLSDSFREAGTVQVATAGQYDRTKVEQVTQSARNIALTKAKGQQDNIKEADGTNIYAAPPLQSVLAPKAIQESKWYQGVMAVQMQAGGLKEFNSEQLVSMTAQAVKSGKLSYNDAADGLRNVFVSAAATNNAIKNYEGVGLPPQTSYKTELKNSIGIPRKVDLLTPQDIARVLSERMKDAPMQQGGGFGLYN